ncbi:MAG: 1-acyl-sn-glycerol-3-phosphate acyltransferase [Bacilli bacterium]|nr:1-acyl-sn-glycerol-3-phosphate acyltransferase [Bacilli bacterium]
MNNITFNSVKNDIKNNESHSLSYLLNDEVEKTLSKKGIKIRKIFAPFLRFIYSFQSDYKFVLESRDKLEHTKKGKIFVVNHRQGDDMVFSAKAVGKSGYFVFGNKTLALESFSNGYGLWMYGMILLNRDSKTNRKACYEKMKYLIENGANVIIFPEGYWNLADDGQKDERHGADYHNSENWLIQDINIGALRLSKETGCQIVPTVLHYDEQNKMKCYAMRGKALNVTQDDDIYEKKDELLQNMFDMYWELMSKHSNYSRKELESQGITLKEQWEELKKKLIAFCDIESVNYKLDLKDEKRIGKAPIKDSITTNEEAFEHLNNIEYNKENAFLLSKRLSGINR